MMNIRGQPEVVACSSKEGISRIGLGGGKRGNGGAESRLGERDEWMGICKEKRTSRPRYHEQGGIDIGMCRRERCGTAAFGERDGTLEGRKLDTAKTKATATHQSHPTDVVGRYVCGDLSRLMDQTEPIQTRTDRTGK
jgi:hypothetical protein